ncbi:cytochrome-dependent sulfide dehydrogenase (flavoprotein) [Hoeflea halophila]|uniref:Cytochrome-dependent sulfide dehydrogenase (Flavoprotein) n=1 Tax=Hoeflea halophila TaxID=714899 RepID=A0A286HLZ6_9HYPH|nr:NAD(P)/FAD-dependent oxidoreductase [Hoeflea halophila]SOE08737.1 cytochrome-dependent sulfide dehydrogenase (flavoprotein) [Hoeflea halophila]
MAGLTRRQFGLFTGASAAALSLPTYLRAQGKPRVVVIGGGAGGATAARYIAKDSDGAIDVTLIENSDNYTTCFYSNLYVGGFRSFESITHSYDTLQSSYGITKVTGMATAVDRENKVVTMADGATVPYDRLVVAPGIDLIWDSVEGYSEELSQKAPHAWKAGEQTKLLKAGLDAIENGQQILMVAPPNPYRCPPGPYERASMMAHVLKSKGLMDAKVIILDPKPKFSKQGVFQEGWEKHYPGMIEWYGPDVHGGIESVDVAAGTVETGLDTFKGAFMNIIPAQKAGEIAGSAGLTDDSGFCPIEAESMRSSMDEAIFVIGDACIAGDMPKSGFSANSQAKVAAMTIRGDLVDAKVFPAKYANTCWSLIETDDSIKVGAQYAPGDGKIASTQSFVSQMDEDAALRKANYEESVGWYEGITEDMFG